MNNPLGIIRAGSEKDFNTNTFRGNINVSDICNFSCSYCINNASKTKGKRILDKGVLEGFIEDVAARKHDRYLFAIAGGEPLIYPHIVFLVEKIAHTMETDNVVIRFATNGSRLCATGQKLYAAAQGKRLRFSISVHLEQIDLKQFATDIKNFGHHEDITCKILLAPGKLDECRKILDHFDLYGIKTILQPVTRAGGEPVEYCTEELDLLNNHKTVEIKHIFHDYEDGSHEEFDRVTRGLHPEKINYYGMLCMAGANTLRLGPDGSVVPCFGAWSVENNKRSWFYDLNQQRLRDIPQLTRPRTCPANYCGCLTFLQTPKWSSEDLAPVFYKKGTI